MALVLPRLLKLAHLIIIIGLGISIVGAIDRTKTDQSSLDTGATLLKIATLVFFVVWAALCLASIYFWAIRYQLSPIQRTVCHLNFDSALGGC